MGYVFGVLEASAVPGSILVPLLVDLGMSPGAVRTMLHRMVAAGNLVSERVGRIAVYRLAGGYAHRFGRLRDGEQPPPRWAGRLQLVLYDIPEASRQHRDELRETAFKAGFGATRPGVLIGLQDPRGWCEPWLDSPLSVELGELVCDLPTARRLAEQAWGLTSLQPILTTFATDLQVIEDELGREAYDDRSVFRLQALLWERWVGILIGLPTLPLELTPDPWPVGDLAEAMVRLTRRLQPRAMEHSETVVARADRADLLELLPDPKHRRSDSRVARRRHRAQERGIRRSGR